MGRSLGPPACLPHFQPRLDRRLCAGPFNSALGRCHCRNVPVPLLELFFSAGDFLARWRHRRRRSLLNGDRRADGDQARPDHDRARDRWNFD
jgi:hypothetical protein